MMARLMSGSESRAIGGLPTGVSEGGDRLMRGSSSVGGDRLRGGFRRV